MTTKLVNNLDEDTWRTFAGYCKSKNKRVGDKLTEILQEYMKDKIV